MAILGRILRILFISVFAFLGFAGLCASVTPSEHGGNSVETNVLMSIVMITIGFAIWRFCGGYNQLQEDRRTREIARGLTPHGPSLEEVAAAREEARASLREQEYARAAARKAESYARAEALRAGLTADQQTPFENPGIPPPYSPSWTGYGRWPYYRRLTPAQTVAGGVSSAIFMIVMLVWLLHGFNQDCTTSYTSSGSINDSTSHMTTSCH